MKILHLFSNSKWTGPAEPALRLCLSQRAQGATVDFACSSGADLSVNKIVATARDHALEPLLDFHLGKHNNPLKNWLDRRLLTRLLRERGYDVVHCHLDNDHRIALGAARAVGTPLIRSSYEGTGFLNKKTHTSLMRGMSVLLEPSQRAAEHDRRVYGLSDWRVEVVAPAVDLERFDPSRETPDGRRWLQIPGDAFVVGIVARLQTHRHYEDFFEAIARLVAEAPHTRVIVVGRGTKQESVGREPVRRLGLDGHVHFAGFIEGENYVGMLKAFDVKVFMQPGTDGTCRAVREAMAMGKAAVVTERGMLPELVADGRDGLVCDGSVEGLHGALRSLALDRVRTRAMGRAAREKALREWSLGAQAARVLGVYERVLGGGAKG